ncbi:ABC transporter substrate-binding protein [Streptomyces corynorhini]|nr:ABC transporter substrate-binding protein [Streptomyces corynorhini]
MPHSTRPSSGRVVTVGVHPHNPSLFVLRRLGVLEPMLARLGAVVEWVEYDDGRCTIDLFAEAEIDFGGTGSMPPVQAQSEGVEIVYVAVSDPRPGRVALVVPADSSIRTVADLRGRRVAMTDGSCHSELLASVLESVGIGYHDIVVLDGNADENRSAFESGEAEARVTGDPHVAEARRSGSLRVLAEAGAEIADRSVWWAGRAFAVAEPRLLETLVRALRVSDAWAARHPREAAGLFAAGVPGSPDAAAWETALRRGPWGLRPVSADVVAEQQTAADRYVRLGMIPAPVSIADAVLAPVPALLGSAGPVVTAASASAYGTG